MKLEENLEKISGAELVTGKIFKVKHLSAHFALGLRPAARELGTWRGEVKEIANRVWDRFPVLGSLLLNLWN